MNLKPNHNPIMYTPKSKFGDLMQDGSAKTMEREIEVNFETLTHRFPPYSY